MLPCKKNYSFGGKNKNCDVCVAIDDENHRINVCEKYQSVNVYNSSNKIDFALIYSNRVGVLLKVVDIILKVWDIGNGRNVR